MDLKLSGIFFRNLLDLMDGDRLTFWTLEREQACPISNYSRFITLKGSYLIRIYTLDFVMLAPLFCLF